MNDTTYNLTTTYSGAPQANSISGQAQIKKNVSGAVWENGTIDYNTNQITFSNVTVGATDASASYTLRYINGKARDSVTTTIYNKTTPKWIDSIPDYTVNLGDIISINLNDFILSPISGNIVGTIPGSVPGSVSQVGNVLKINTNAVSTGTLATILIKRAIGDGSYTEEEESNPFNIVVLDTTTSIKALDISNNIAIYPNPIKDKIVIAIKDLPAFQGKYEIYNMLGKVIAKGALTNASTTVNVTHLNAGMYVIRISNKEGAKISFLLEKL